MKTKLFGPDDVGCYADGAFGHQHARDVLAGLVERWDAELADSLRGKMPDDDSDTNAALDLLNDHTTEGVYWDFLNGDLILSEAGSEWDNP